MHKIIIKFTFRNLFNFFFLNFFKVLSKKGRIFGLFMRAMNLIERLFLIMQSNKSFHIFLMYLQYNTITYFVFVNLNLNDPPHFPILLLIVLEHTFGYKKKYQKQHLIAINWF